MVISETFRDYDSVFVRETGVSGTECRGVAIWYRKRAPTVQNERKKMIGAGNALLRYKKQIQYEKL